MNHSAVTLLVYCILFCSSCATFYEVNRDFNNAFEQGKLEQAKTILDKNKKFEKGKDKLLYLLNEGVVLSMLGEFEASNTVLEDAYLYTEDYHKNYFAEAASFLTNPAVVPYKGEHHEHLFILYYKALNYLQMSRYDEAMVECRRLNLSLQTLSDKYDSENKYKRDAFIHTLMGIIYEAKKEYNDAFIAYRNALDIYRSDYAEMFQVAVPNQLKEDILRTAWLTGFKEEFDTYKQEFNSDYTFMPTDGQLVFFWNNGLGPVKSEWSINFVVTPGSGGIVNITNDEYGFSFPFSVPDDNERNSLTDLEVFRVAFPKYVERDLYFKSAYLKVKDQEHPLDLAEDVNAIAFKNLRQRMVREFSKSLLRAGLKKASEKAIEQESEGLGLAVSFLNAFTEKADTRNWQTLPHSIYYTRIPLDTGKQEVVLHKSTGLSGGDQERVFNYTVEEGQTIFQPFYSLEYDHFRYR